MQYALRKRFVSVVGSIPKHLRPRRCSQLGAGAEAGREPTLTSPLKPPGARGWSRKELPFRQQTVNEATDIYS